MKITNNDFSNLLKITIKMKMKLKHKRRQKRCALSGLKKGHPDIGLPKEEMELNIFAKNGKTWTNFRVRIKHIGAGNFTVEENKKKKTYGAKRLRL